MKYIIYGHHCKITDKWYIGQTSQAPFKRLGHNGNKYLYKRKGQFIHNKFANAILKYGWNSFDHIILEETTEIDVDYYEDFYIRKYNSVENGYNNLYGGK